MILYAYYVDASKNGAIVGTVCKEKEMKGRLFPTIAVHSQNEEYVSPSVLCIYMNSLIYML